MDAQILPWAQAKSKHLGGFSQGLFLVSLQLAELLQHLLHLVHGTSAVDEFSNRWVGEHIAGDEGQEGDGLPRPRRHLQQAMPLRIQRPLEVHHVVILLGIYVLIRKVDRQALYLEPHGAPQTPQTPSNSSRIQSYHHSDPDESTHCNLIPHSSQMMPEGHGQSLHNSPLVTSLHWLPVLLIWDRPNWILVVNLGIRGFRSQLVEETRRQAPWTLGEWRGDVMAAFYTKAALDGDRNEPWIGSFLGAL